MQMLTKNKLLFLLTLSLSAGLSIPTSASGLQECQGNYQLADGYYNHHNNYNNSASDGRSGENGSDGASKTIFANGTPVNLDLSGQDGRDGRDGRDASSPHCGHLDYGKNKDVHATNGKNGGNGGSGGSGGNGGNLTVYYTNLADLKNILIRSRGGKGGIGGRGGNGSNGCDCHEDSWEVETCKGTPGTPEHKCKTKTYHCHDGADGRDGADGGNGKSGNLGILSIVRGNQELQPDRPTMKLPISQLENKSINLSKNKWNTRDGAFALLAPGSIIAEQYREFERRIEGEFQLDWQDRKSAASFADQTVTLSLNDDQQVKIDFSEDLWVSGNYVTQNQSTKYNLVYAIRRQDVTKLKVADFDGSGKNVNLKIVDLGGRADLLQTAFTVKFSTQNGERLYDRTEYKAKIPSELVTRDYNRYIIALGKLAIPDRALEPGVEVEIELTATRTLGERSAKQTINWKDSIR